MKSINQMTYDFFSKDLQNATINFKGETPSTNTWATNEFPVVNHDFALYLADLQTEGKGRDGRTWQQSQAGHCLLSTWCFRTPKMMQPIFSPLVGLAVFSSLKSVWQEVPFALKAPNDIYVGDKKIAGILIEAQTGAAANTHDIYVGLGLNIYSAPEVDQPTIALSDLVEIDSFNWAQFLEYLSSHLKAATQDGSLSQLDEFQRKKLLLALNASPKTNYSDVSPTGDLKSGETVTSWRDL